MNLLLYNGDWFMRVFGDKYRVLRKSHPDSIWYVNETQTKGFSFEQWREAYVKDFKVNTAEVIFNGILDSRPIKITLNQLFDLGSKHAHFGESIRSIAMKCAYTGTDPKEEYVKLIELSATVGTKWLLQYI